MQYHSTHTPATPIKYEFVTGYGSGDSHAIYLSDGRANASPNAGLPYDRVSLVDLYAMMQNPPSVPKAQAQWIIPSEYNAHDARGHRAQHRNGKYMALSGDVDEGNPSREEVCDALRNVLGAGAAFVVYSTSGATEVNRKWRFLVPIKEVLTGAGYSAFQAALFDSLPLTLDRSLERTGQVLYLPNRGDHYEWHAEGTFYVDLQNHPLRAKAEKLLREAADVKKRTTQASEGMASPIRYFRSTHSIQEMLAKAGFEPHPHNDTLWRHPDQSTPGYGGLRIMEYADSDRWVSLSTTINELGIGKLENGKARGDAFDIAVHLLGQDKALEYARQLMDHALDTLAAEGDAIYQDLSVKGRPSPNQERQMHIEAVEATSAALREHERLDVSNVQGAQGEWDLEWPDTPFMDIAKWIYKGRAPIKQYAIGQALMAVLRMSGGRYAVDRAGIHLYALFGGATSVGKGVNLIRREQLVRAAFKAAHAEHNYPNNYSTVPASAQGIQQEFQEPYTMLNVYQEDARATMKALTNPTNQTTEQLASSLATLWSGSSGPYGNMLKKSYAKVADNLGYVVGPSMAFGIDTQIASVNAFLDGPNAEVGLMQRFTYFVYAGSRTAKEPVEQPDAQVMPQHVVEQLGNLYKYQQGLTGDTVNDVQWSECGLAQYKDIARYYREATVGNDDNILLRAHENVKRVAAIIAIYENPHSPVICQRIAHAAFQIIDTGYKYPVDIIGSGMAGSGESVRLARLCKALREYKDVPPNKLSQYKVPKCLQGLTDVISIRYIKYKLCRHPDFKGTDNGLTTYDNIDKTIKEAIDQGVMRQVTPEDVRAIHLGFVAPLNINRLFMLTEEFWAQYA